jgi:hypothetical protein
MKHSKHGIEHDFASLTRAHPISKFIFGKGTALRGVRGPENRRNGVLLTQLRGFFGVSCFVADNPPVSEGLEETLADRAQDRPLVLSLQDQEG